MKTSFGLDLAGFAGGKSAFCRIDLNDEKIATATVYSGHIFAEKVEGSQPFSGIVQKEVELLAACCKKASIFIDSPIDLQGLPYPENSEYPWQLTKRPVDFAFNALAPLAERIGYPCARILNTYARLTKDFENPLGNQIFETYPAASLELLNLPSKGYKGEEITFRNGYWDWKKGDKKSELLAEIAEAFKLTAPEGLALNDDEVDSIICAAAGITEENRLLQASELADEIRKRLQKKLNLKNIDKIPTSEPEGYVLLKKLPAFETRVEKKAVKTAGEMLKEVLR